MERLQAVTSTSRPFAADANSNLQAGNVDIGGMSKVKAVQRMPFTIRIVDDEMALLKAVDIRQAAYGRHIPELASRLGAPEQADHAAGSVVLLAESKFDGTSLGTMRIQTNRFLPLGVEKSITLPDWLHGHSLAEATRLGVSGGQVGRVAKTMLFKAFFEYCVAQKIDWMVITARSPLDRQYEALLFQEVFPDQGFIPMRHVGNLPHRVLAFEVATAQIRWKAAAHPLYDFIFETTHPDLRLDPQQGMRVGKLDLLAELSFRPETGRARALTA